MDCSKTTDFFSEVKRLCDSRAACEAVVPNGEQCPLFEFCEHTLTTIRAEEAIKAIEILQKWSNEHLKKTYAQDFFEKFPKAQGCADGSPFVCRKRIYGGKISSRYDTCDYAGACQNCWNEPLNDE